MMLVIETVAKRPLNSGQTAIKYMKVLAIERTRIRGLRMSLEITSITTRS